MQNRAEAILQLRLCLRFRRRHNNRAELVAPNQDLVADDIGLLGSVEAEVWLEELRQGHVFFTAWQHDCDTLTRAALGRLCCHVSFRG